jgi:hypothetical protein
MKRRCLIGLCALASVTDGRFPRLSPSTEPGQLQNRGNFNRRPVEESR